MPKFIFFQDLEGLTEVFGRMSAGISAPKLPLWAGFSFLNYATKKQKLEKCTCKCNRTEINLERPCARREGVSMLLRREGGFFRREGGFFRRGVGFLRRGGGFLRRFAK